MKPLGNLPFAVCFGILMAGLLVGLSSGFKDAPKQPAENSSPIPSDQTEKPRPSAGKESPAQAAANPAGRVLSLSEAVAIAEKIVGGQAIKAERKGKSEVSFKIEVVQRDGTKSKIELTADGKLKETRPPETKRQPEQPR